MVRHPLPTVPAATLALARVGDRPGHTLNGDDLLADGAPGLRLAGLLVLSVHEDRARSTEAGTAAELRPVQAENVPENPQQRCRGVPVVDLEVRAVHRQ